MLKVGVMVSGGGTNLQAIIDGVHSGVITNAKLEVVISNKKDAYALTRAKDNGIKAESVCIKDYATRDEFNKALIGTIDSYNLDLIVLAGFLVVLPEELINKYRNRIINIHPSLIPSFCGNGFYGLHVHEKALERGVKITGATVHFVDEGTDTGPIIYQKAVEVQPQVLPPQIQVSLPELSPGLPEADWQPDCKPDRLDSCRSANVPAQHEYSGESSCHEYPHIRHTSSELHNILPDVP